MNKDKGNKYLHYDFYTNLSDSAYYVQFLINVLSFTMQTTVVSYNLSIIWNTVILG